MKDFLRHLLIVSMQRYGSFMWFGTHVGVTQTEWHWILETSLCIVINILMILGIYFEWKDQPKKC